MGKMLVTYKRILLFSMAVSISVCIVIGYIAIQHNPMGQYCKPISAIECEIVWANIFPLLSMWFLVIGVPTILTLSSVNYVVNKSTRAIK